MMLQRGDTLAEDRKYYKKGRKRLFIRICRLMNFIAAIFMIVNAVLRVVNLCSGTYKGGDLFFYVMTLYLLGFSVLLVAAEWRSPKVLLYAEFLQGRLGKGLYLFLIGLLVFDDQRKADMLIGISFVLIGLFNVLVSFMRRDPDDYEDFREGLQDDEDEYDDELQY